MCIPVGLSSTALPFLPAAAAIVHVLPPVRYLYHYRVVVIIYPFGEYRFTRIFLWEIIMIERVSNGEVGLLVVEY